MAARRIALMLMALLVVGLGSVLALGVSQGGWQPVPKLALDLEGGTQVILQASAPAGETISAEQMEQAREIMSQRINAMGVAETEISVQGGTNIVVNVPGEIDERTSQALRRTATMSFRPVLFEGAPEADGAASDAGGASDAGARSPESFGPTLVSGPSPSASGDADAVPAWDPQWLATGLDEQFGSLDCTSEQVRQDHDVNANPDGAVVACSADGFVKYVLGPVVVAGDAITNASPAVESNPNGQPTGYYVVNLEFDAQGGERFGQMSSALFSGEGATRQFAIVLDSLVISAPEVQAVTTTESSISGRFTAQSAQELANQLKFGALPLEFTVQSEQQISATLGSDQLNKGLIAGVIGLALVMLYAAFQYRVLSIVTASSLVLMGTLAYIIITIMSNLPEIGYRLSLAGVTGLIVSIAFTADSFIVYFERIRDEIRDGRGVQAAVDHGWRRARSTILASDAVNLIAAIVLYAVSAGSVRGFAFTLGLTTVLDLIIVFLFTHPLLRSLTRTRFFGKGHPLSGLDPALLGRDVPAYAGRGRFRDAHERGSRRSRRAGHESAEDGETLAERKARLARTSDEQRNALPETHGPLAGPSLSDDSQEGDAK